LHLGFAAGATHLGFHFPELSIGTDVDIPTCDSGVTIPPVMLNSHLVNFMTLIDVCG